MASPNPPIPENVEDLAGPPDAVAPPIEPVCPTLPGVKFPELPDIASFGSLIGTKISSLLPAIPVSVEDLKKKSEALEKRIKNPPSATDMMNELSTQVSSAADKAAAALEKAALDTAAQVEENLAAEWDKQVEFAKNSGLADIYAGFKNAAACLKGAPGGAEEAFNKTAPELDAGVAEGRGQDGATAALDITETSKVGVNESGDKVSEQVPLTKEKVDELRAEQQEKLPEKPITANPVPVPEVPLVVQRNAKDHAEKLASEGIPVPDTLPDQDPQSKSAVQIRAQMSSQLGLTFVD